MYTVCSSPPRLEKTIQLPTNEQVSRSWIGRWGFQSSVVDRGCASSLKVECEQPYSTSTETAAMPAMGNRHHGSDRADEGHDRSGTSGSSKSDSLRKLHCCSTDLCNGSEDARSERQRRSEEHRRTLMEGNSWDRRSSWGSYFTAGSSFAVSSDGHATGTTAAVDETIADGGDDNSAQPTRGRTAGGSRFATVLVIVGTFSQVLWLVSSLVH